MNGTFIFLNKRKTNVTVEEVREEEAIIEFFTN